MSGKLIMARNEKAVGKFFESSALMPLEHDRYAGAQIYERLASAILHMDIAPGSLIPEIEVGRRFQASRTPVREALQQLREAGLVVTSAGRGNFATKLSDMRIREAQFIREIIELGVVRNICENGIDAPHLAQLRENLDQQQECLSTERKLDFRALDDEFHLILARATGSDRLAEILIREKMALDRLRALSLDEADHMGELVTQHTAIFRAVEKRQKKAARRLMQAHLRTVLTTLESLADRHREYFE